MSNSIKVTLKSNSILATRGDSMENRAESKDFEYVDFKPKIKTFEVNKSTYNLNDRKNQKIFDALIEEIKHEEYESASSSITLGKIYLKDKNIILNGVKNLISNKKDKDLDLFIGSFLFAGCKDFDKDTSLSIIKYCLESNNSSLQEYGVILVGLFRHSYDLSSFENCKVYKHIRKTRFFVS